MLARHFTWDGYFGRTGDCGGVIDATAFFLRRMRTSESLPELGLRVPSPSHRHPIRDWSGKACPTLQPRAAKSYRPLAVPAISRRLQLVTMLDSKPFRVPFPIRVACIPLVQQMAKLMKQDVVQIEIAHRFFRPNELPCRLAAVHPTSAEHLRFIHLQRRRGAIKRFHQRVIDRIKV